MVLHNPNNWHWVMKDAGQWAKDYIETESKKVSAEQDGVSAQITKLVSMDGDVEVSQRKGKVITIFDVVLQLEYEGMNSQRAFGKSRYLTTGAGKTSDGTDVSGSIRVPECAYDTEPDEYVVCSCLPVFSNGSAPLTPRTVRDRHLLGNERETTSQRSSKVETHPGTPKGLFKPRTCLD